MGVLSQYISSPRDSRTKLHCGDQSSLDSETFKLRENSLVMPLGATEHMWEKRVEKIISGGEVSVVA